MRRVAEGRLLEVWASPGLANSFLGFPRFGGHRSGIRICKDLLEEGAILQILDPKVSEQQIAQDLGLPASHGEGSWKLVADVHQAASGADALLLHTEWQQFSQIDWPAVAPLMRQPAWLFDARAKADAAAAKAAGRQVWTVGEGSPA